MLCECGQHEATIHEVIITSDKRKVERHLCEDCAAKQGVSNDPYVPIDQLISTTNYIMGQVITTDAHTEGSAESLEPSSSHSHPRPSNQAKSTQQTCVGCGQTFARFKKSGLLGCPACYQTFEDRVGPIIERAHEGGCSHVGKVPRRALGECKDSMDQSRIESLLGDIRQREERLETLRHQLEKTIHAEDYEQAAMIRDELTRLTSLAASQIEHRPQDATGIGLHPSMENPVGGGMISTKIEASGPASEDREN